MTKTRIGLAIAASLCCGVSTAALAQTAASDDSAAAADEGDIIVTAQRREERLQDVPIAVQVQSAEQLETRGITGVQALGEVVPSLSVSSAVGFAITYMRGVGSTAIGPGIETPISIYVDGVYYASSTSALFDFNNISRIEVLKGPQGTLFGRNATGGLIQVVTADPSRDLDVRVGASLDNYLTTKGKFYVSGGLGESIAADLAVTASTQGEGWGKNVSTGDEVNKNIHNISLRSKWLFELGDTTEVRLIGDFTDQANSFNGQRIFKGTVLPAFYGNIPFNAGDEWDLDGDFVPRVDNRNWGVSARIDQEIGDLTLSSITAYRKSKTHLRWDIDFTPVPHFEGNLIDIEKQFSQELQLSSDNDGPLVWTAGVYYFRARGIYDPSQVFSRDVPNNLFGPFETVLLFGNQLTESIAGYGQGTLSVGPSTKLTLGARYTYEKREIDGRTEAGFFGSPTTLILLGTVPHDETSFEKPTFRVSLDHRFSPEVLGYVSFNTGFKSGGFNTQFASDPSFLPETIKAYEAGLKTNFDNVRLNFAGYYYDYKNIQVQKVGLAATGIINGASARIYGAEVEFDANLSEAFNLAGSLAYTNAEFKEFTNAPFTGPNGGIAQFPGDASGNRIPKSPRLQGNLSATYTVDMANGSKLAFNATGIYSSRYFFEANNIVSQDAYAKLNASVSWTPADDHYTVRIFGNNLTNKANATYSSTLSDGTIDVSYDPPRIVGIALDYRY